MNIIFTTEPDGTICAIAQEVEIDGWFYEEIMYAEIMKEGAMSIVRWEDSYSDKHTFLSEEEARQYVLKNYNKHNFHNNGIKYEIE